MKNLIHDENEDRYFERTGKRVMVVQVGQWYLGESGCPGTAIRCATAAGDFTPEGRELLREVAAPAQGEPGEALQKLAEVLAFAAFGVKSKSAEDEFGNQISEALRPLLEKARAYWNKTVCLNRFEEDELDTELTRWERTEGSRK